MLPMASSSDSSVISLMNALGGVLESATFTVKKRIELRNSSEMESASSTFESKTIWNLSLAPSNNCVCK